MTGVHNVFHVSHLRKCVHDSSVIVSLDELEELEDEPEAARPIRLVQIVKHNTRQLRNKVVKLIRVQWSEHEGDSTWETEESTRSAYLDLFQGTLP